MRVYNYDEVGEYFAASEARESPLEPGVYLVPAHATLTAPPEVQSGYARVWSGTAWTQVEDHRGATVYAATTGAAQEITALGPLPEGVTTAAPGSCQKWDAATGGWVTDAEAEAVSARAERDAALTACEWLVIRHRDQTDAGAGTTLAATQYAELLAYRQSLRDWPTAAGWPNVDLPAEPAWLAAAAGAAAATTDADASPATSSDTSATTTSN